MSFWIPTLIACAVAAWAGISVSRLGKHPPEDSEDLSDLS